MKVEYCCAFFIFWTLKTIKPSNLDMTLKECIWEKHVLFKIKVTDCFYVKLSFSHAAIYETKFSTLGREFKLHQKIQIFSVSFVCIPSWWS